MNPIMVTGLVLGCSMVSSGVTALVLGRGTVGAVIAGGGVAVGAALAFVARGGGAARGSRRVGSGAAGGGGGAQQGEASTYKPSAHRAQYTPRTQPMGAPTDHLPIAEQTVSQDFVPDHQAHAVPGLGAIYKELSQPGVEGFIIVVAGPDRGRGLPVGGGEPVTVGRGGHNTIALRDNGASATHCQFFARDGRVWVEDTASKNGTFVNNEPVTKVALENCDVVALGSTRILVATM
jgi:hypothetical protein